MQLNQHIEDICELSGAKVTHILHTERFMTVSGPCLIWETKRDNKTDDYDRGLCQDKHGQGKIRMTAYSSWNRNGGRVESSVENQAKPDASYSLVSPAPFLYICVCLSVWFWSAAPKRGQ